MRSNISARLKLVSRLCAILAIVIPSSAFASARIEGVALPADAITAIMVHDNGSGPGRPVTFGIPLAQGIVSDSENLIVTDVDGSVIPTQWNPLATWRTDGSILHGVLSFLTTESGTAEGVYFVKKGAQPSVTSEITKSDLTAAGFSAEVRLVIGGTAYSLSAEDLLNKVVSPRMDYTHFSGPIASEFVVGGPLRVDETGAQHSTLQAYFYLRAFGKPVSRAHVTLVLENTGAFNPLNDIVVDQVELRVGGAIVPGFPKAPFTVHADIRYPKRTWWTTSPDIWVQHDLEYVSETKLMPAYRPVQMSEAVLSGFDQASDWNERRVLSSENLEGGGAKPELAPHDRWTAAYMVSGDRRAWNAMRAAVDEYSMMVSNLSDGVVHARDEETGFPLDLTKKGVVGRIWFGNGGEDVLAATRDGKPVAQTDIAHWPSIAYLTYLLTGESNEMENVQHSAIQVWLNEAPGGEKGTIPGRPLRWLQTRGMAWALREMVNGAVVTPDHHPLRFALQASATYALEEYSKAGQAADPSGTVGLWGVTRGAFPYDDRTGLAPWMNDYLTWAVGDAFERGWSEELTANGFWRWKAQGVVGRMGTSVEDGFCWEYAARYSLKARASISDSLYESWNRIFRENHPTVNTCAIPGASSIGSDRDATDYGAQMAGALAVAVSTNMDHAASAWDIYEKRQKSWSYDFDQTPEWAIIPRGQLVRPRAPGDLLIE